MKNSAKAAISMGIVGGGAGIPAVTYDQLVLKKIRHERKEFEKTFNNKKDSINGWEMAGISKDTNPEIAAEIIREWCQSKLESPLNNKNVWSTFISACESKLSTVKALLEDEIPFIEEDEDYEVSLFFLNYVPQDKRKINTEIEEINWEKIKVWCNEQLNKKVSEVEESLLSVINEACKIHPLNTAEQLFNYRYPEWSITSDWETTFEKWKDTPTLITLLNKNNTGGNISSSTDKYTGGTALKNWCKKEKDKKFSSETNDNLFDHILFVCSGNNPPITKEIPNLKSK